MRASLASVLLLVLCLPAAVPAAAADAGSGLLVPADVVLRVDRLVVDGDLVVDGLVESVGDLVLDVAGDVVVRGVLRAGHGAPGAGGGSVRVAATGRLAVEEGGRVEAGAGGHGAPDVLPGGAARGQDGGKGGDVLLQAASFDLAGALLPGEGGRGGDAYGATARGGDGGSSGRALANGAPVRVERLVPHPDAPSVLRDLLPAETMSHCNPTDTGSNAGVSGQDGGDACAHGLAGAQGGRGTDGNDDNCAFSNCCTNGTNGSDGLVGGPATATGGMGGSTYGGPAGDGGDATATGGTGGRGGDGGMGGNSALVGNACDGGNGGNGGLGGAATATSGIQGLNLLDCAQNGASGVALAVGGPGGAGGWRGGGGGANAPYNDGDDGSDGYTGGQGAGLDNEPPVAFCFTPGAPVLLALWPTSLTPGEVTLQITTAIDGGSPITHYKLYRDTAPGVNALDDTGVTIPWQVGVTEYTDTGLTVGVRYYYKVVAVNGVGLGAFSNEANSKPCCMLFAPPSPGPELTALVASATDTVGDVADHAGSPVLAAAPGRGQGEVQLTWTGSGTSGARGWYEVYRFTPGTPVVLVAKLAPTGPVERHVDRGLATDGATAYSYWVAWVDGTGARRFSEEATAVPNPGTPLG